MTDLDAIDEIERAYSLPDGQPTLGRAFTLLEERWRSGARDRETTLRLLFLAWYLDEEPPSYTGATPDLDTVSAFREVVDTIVQADPPDAECLFAVGSLLSFRPWHLTDERAAATLGDACLARSRALHPADYVPEHFVGRGQYGEYFAHIIRGGGFRWLNREKS